MPLAYPNAAEAAKGRAHSGTLFTAAWLIFCRHAVGRGSSVADLLPAAA
jgi:hypothetical protein